MRNRKTLLHSALCLTVLSAAASCTNYLDNIQENSTSMDSAIEVSAMIGSGADAWTKAPSSSEVTTATLTKFWMSAFKSKTDTVKGTTNDQAKTALVLFDRPFTRTDGVFSDDGNYYWAKGDIKFCAVAATEGASIVKPSGSDSIKVSWDSVYVKDFKIDSTGSLSKFQNQEDYIIAVNKTSKPSGTNKVSLTFQHILSRISINAYAPNFKTNRPYLANFAFDSVTVKGSFVYTGSETDSVLYYKNDTSGVKCWSSSKADTTTVGSRSDVWYSNKVFKLDTLTNNKRLSSGVNIVPWLNVIPCGTVARHLYLTLWYQDKKWDNVLDLTGITALTEYKPGYQYIYNISVSGSDDAEGEKERPQIELVNIVVQEWNSHATSATLEAPDAGNGNTLKKTIVAAQKEGKKNLEIKLSSNVVTEVTMRDSVSITTNVVIDLNDHTLIPSADTSAFFVSGGHRLAIKGTGTVKVDTVYAIGNDKLKTLESSSDSFAIRGGTWSFDPQRLVPGFSEVQTYPALSDEVTTSYITITGPSYKYTVTRGGSGTTDDPYSYTVGESSLN